MESGTSGKPAYVTGTLEKQYVERAARSTPGVVVFSPEVAIEIIEEAKRRNIATWGLDAFLLHPEGAIQPVMEHDLNSRDHETVIAHLRRFIGTSFYFEVSTD